MLLKYAKNALQYLKNNLIWKDYIVLLLSLSMGVYLRWNIFEIVIFLIFIYIILYPVPSRQAVFPAVILLVITPFFLIFKKDSLAEQVAIYAYYFLIMAVVMGIYELWKGDSGKEM